MERKLRLMAAEERPVENSAMPPRHLEEERFPTSLVERTRIVSGGPPPDGIRSIDEPGFEPVRDVDWLQPDEAVLSLEVQGVARAYPVRILMWHEIVNDRIGDVPLAVTYCPLCNSAVAFDRRTDGTLEFGTSGALYQSALVMYDRETETLWTHFDGLAVIGTLVGTELERIPVATVTWEDFHRERPDGDVLGRDTGYDRDYGRDPYIGYENLERPLTGFTTGETDPRRAPIARVIGVGNGAGAVAVATTHARDVGVVDLEVQGRPVTVWHLPGLVSALDDREARRAVTSARQGRSSSTARRTRGTSSAGARSSSTPGPARRGTCSARPATDRWPVTSSSPRSTSTRSGSRGRPTCPTRGWSPVPAGRASAGSAPMEYCTVSWCMPRICVGAGSIT